MSTNFLSGLTDMPGGSNVSEQEPENLIQAYDKGLSKESFDIASLVQGVQMQEAQSMRADVSAERASAQDVMRDSTGFLGQLQQGADPMQEFAPPEATLGGLAQQTGRSLVAGWGDLVEGTGNSVDFIASLVTPWEPKINTSVGEWLRGAGQKIQSKNQVYADASLDEVTWADMANPEFWSTKVARLIPYAFSFMIPYVAGARIGSKLLLGAAKGASTVDKFGKLGKGLKGYEFATKGSGILGKLAYDAGVKGVQLTKAGKISSTLIGGGITANLVEGAYVAGEALKEAESLGFSPEEARSIASEVYQDNMKWMGMDIVQFGIAFGGLGRMTSQLSKLAAENASFARKIRPIVVNTLGLAGAEGVFEQYQEVYQEWIKRKAIAEEQGDDFMPYSEFFQSDEMMETRVSSFALGAIMGARGGYVDAQAERSYQIEQKKREYNNIVGGEGQFAELEYSEQVLLQSIIDHNGSGDYARAFLNDQLKNNRITQENYDTHLQAIEKYEEVYNRFNVEENLMNAAKERIFRKQILIEKKKIQIESLQESKQTKIKNAKDTIKNDPEGLQEMLNQIEEETKLAEENINKEIIQLETEISQTYRLKRVKLKKDGTPKKSSSGLTQEQFEQFSKEEAKKVEEAQGPGILQRVGQAAKKAVGAVVGAVTSPRQTATEVSEGLKSAVNTFKESAFAKRTQENKIFQATIGKVSDAVSSAINSDMTVAEATAAAIAAVKATDVKGKTKALYDFVRSYVKETIEAGKEINMKDLFKTAAAKGKEDAEQDIKSEDKTPTEEVKKKDQIKIKDTVKGIIAIAAASKPAQLFVKAATATKDVVVDLFDKITYSEEATLDESKLTLSRFNYIDIILKNHLSKKFPNKDIVVLENEFLDSFGYEQTALILGSTVLVTANEALQTGLIHELGHPYYRLNKDTAFIKALNKLLVKTDLYNLIKENYPDLVMYKFGKSNYTSADIYYELLENVNYDNDSELINALNTITQAKNERERLVAFKRFNKLLVDNKIATELKDVQQEGLLEETFATMLERYAKEGIDSILPNKKDKETFETALKKMWKSTKNGAPTEQESKELLVLAVPQTKDMTLDNAFRYILANFNDEGIVPKVRNSKKGKQINYKRKLFKRIDAQGELDAIVNKYKNQKGSIVTKVNAIKLELYERLGAPDINKKLDAQIEDVIKAKLTYIQSAKDQFDEFFKIAGVEEFTEEDFGIEEEDNGIQYDDKDYKEARKIRELLNQYSNNRSTKDNLVDLTKLRKEFLLIAFTNRAASPSEYVQLLRESNEDIVQDFILWLEETQQSKERANKTLEGLAVNYSGLQIEKFVSYNHSKDRYGKQKMVVKSQMSSIEQKIISSLPQQSQKIHGKLKGGDQQFHKDIEQMFSEDITPEGAIAILEKVFAGISGLQFLDLETIKTQPINYKTQGLKFVHDIMNQNKEQFYNKRFGVQYTKGFKDVVRGVLENSRLNNNIVGIQDVNQNTVAVLNKESSIHKTLRNLQEQYQNNPDKFKKDYDVENNILYRMIVKEQQIDLMQSGGLFSNVTDRSASYDALNSAEKQTIELAAFVSSQKYYYQSLGTLADSKRNYGVLMLKLTGTLLEKEFSKFENKYKNTTYGDGSLVIGNVDELVRKTIEEIQKLPIEKKQILLDVGATNRKQIEEFVKNTIMNRFYLQDALVGSHSNFKNANDYVKRAKGAIAMHTQPFKDVPMEFIVFEDIGDKTDGGAYITQEQAKHINNAFSDVIDVGEVYKFVYYGKEQKNQNPLLFNKTTYGKFNVHTISKEEESKNPVLKKIADNIRERQKVIAESQGIDIDHKHLVIATFESGAKLYNKDYIYNIDTSIEEISQKQNELYFDGEKGTDTYKWSGLDGSNLGIQLELDRKRLKRNLGSQVLPSILPGVTTENNLKLLEEIYDNVIEDLKEALNNNINNIIKDSNELNNKDRQQLILLLEKERNELIGDLQPEGFGLENVELSKIGSRHLPVLHEKIIKAFNNRVSKFGGGFETPGSIGIQGSDAGWNLNAFKTVDELVELNEDPDFADALEKLQEQGKGSYIVSETVVPNYYKTDLKMKKGSLFLGTRIPVHGPPSNAVYIVKDFHSKGLVYDSGSQSPRSIITIPSEVSAAKGSDLDGDAIYVQTQYPTDVSVYQGIDGPVEILSPKKQRVNKVLENLYQIYSSEEFKIHKEKSIEFEETVNNILEKIEGETKIKRYSQLSPYGDSQYYNDNVPAKDIVGILAALNKTLNLVAHQGVTVTDGGITIEGITKDRIQETEGNTDWFSLAQALNIALDNAKYQFAYRLGMTPDTASHFAILLRMGFDLETVARFYNKPEVIQYFINKEKQLVTQSKKIKPKTIPIEIKNTLDKIEKINNELYAITQVLNFYKKIDSNSYIVESLVENLEASSTVLNDSELIVVKNSKLVKHATDMLKLSITKHSATSFMKTGEAQKFVDITKELGIKLDDMSKVMKDYQVLKVGQIINNEFPGILSEVITREDAFGVNNRVLYNKFVELQKNNPNNKFLNDLLIVENEATRASALNVRLNSKIANQQMLNESAITFYKNEFNKLTEEEKQTILQIEYLQNGLGFYNQSFLPYMSNDFVKRISTAIDNYFIEKLIEGVDYNEQRIKIDVQQVLSQNNISSDKFEKSEYFIKIDPKKLFATKNDLLAHLQNKQSRNKTSYKRNLYFNPKDSEYSKLKPKQTFKKWSSTTGGSRTQYNQYAEDYDDMRSFEEQWVDTGRLDSLSMKELYILHDRIAGLSNGTNETALQQIKDVMVKKAFLTQSKKIKEAAKKAGMDVKDPKDLTTIQKWFGANNMPSTNPDIQFLINTLEQQYKEFIIENNKYADRINKAVKDLHNSKKEELRLVLSPFKRNEIMYGKMITRTVNGLELVERRKFLNKNPNEQEIAFYDLLSNITNEFSKFLPENKQRNNYIPHVTSGALEAMGARGLFGLYAYYTGSESDISRVKVFGTNEKGKKVLMTYGEWKMYYAERGNKVDLPSGRAIKELYKLKIKAKKFAKLGQNEDGTAFELSDIEADTLVGGEAFNRFTAKRTVRAKTIPTFDLGKALKEYVKASLFVKGNDNFMGFQYTTPLIDAVIDYNKKQGNKNAVEYLQKVWKDNFIQNKKPVGILGTGVDKVVDGFVKLTSLIHLGINPFVATGNILAGKYQELRKRGGSQFVLGERRYWRNPDKTKQILSKYRVIEYSIDELVGSTNAVDKAAFWFMEISEKWIQGAAFLGELTQEEFDTGIISDARVNEINSRIATTHGEGYTKIDQRLLQMYSLGVAATQFKRWFITYVFDRFQEEDINRFGQHTIGSYRAGGRAAYKVYKMFINNGKFTKEELKKAYDSLSDAEQQEVAVLLRGAGISMITMLLASMFLQDDDEDSQMIGKFLYNAHGDMMVVTDLDRHLNYTLTPASWSTQQNTVRFLSDVVSGEKAKRRSRYLDTGDYKAKSSLLKITPFKYPVSQLVEYENRMETETN